MARLAREYEVEVRIAAKARIGAALRPYLDSVDLVQSVHRSLLIGLRDNKFDISTPEKLVALALTITQRKAARHWRRMRRQNRLSGTHDSASTLAELLVRFSGPSEDPQQTVGNADVIEQILRGLEKTDRDLIELRLQGYSTVAAALRLGLNPDVTRVRLSRLRKRLLQSGVAADLI